MFFSSDAFDWIWLIIAHFFFISFLLKRSKVTSTFYCKSSIDITNSSGFSDFKYNNFNILFKYFTKNLWLLSKCMGEAVKNARWHESTHLLS